MPASSSDSVVAGTAIPGSVNGGGSGDLYDVVLSSVPGLFQIVQSFLSGEMKRFPPDFVPPALYTENYKPPDQGPFLLGFSIATISLAGLVVALRFYARSRRKGPTGLGIDDYMMIVALILTAGYTTINCLAIRYGCLGKHVYDCTVNQVTSLLKTFYAQSPVYLAAGATIKISVLLFYRRLVGPINVRMEWAIRILMGVVVCSTVGSIFALAFMCKPANSYWDLEKLHGGDCPTDFEVTLRYRTVLGLHVATDFIILLLPMKIVYDLNLPWKQKAGLVVLFGTGTGACAASIVRLVYFPVINTDINVTRNGVILCFWGQLEATAAMIAASVPSLKSLFVTKKKRRSMPKNKLTFSSLSTSIFSQKFSIHRDTGSGGTGVKRSNVTMSSAVGDLDLDLESAQDGRKRGTGGGGYPEMVEFNPKTGEYVLSGTSVEEDGLFASLPSYAAYAEGNLSEEIGLGLPDTTTGIDPCVGYIYDPGEVSPLSEPERSGDQSPSVQRSPVFSFPARSVVLPCYEEPSSSTLGSLDPTRLPRSSQQIPRTASPTSFLSSNTSSSSASSAKQPSTFAVASSTNTPHLPSHPYQKLRLQTSSSNPTAFPYQSTSAFSSSNNNTMQSPPPAIQPSRSSSLQMTPNLTATPTSTWAPDPSWSTLPASSSCPPSAIAGPSSSGSANPRKPSPKLPRHPSNPPSPTTSLRGGGKGKAAVSATSAPVQGRRRGASESILGWKPEIFKIPRKPVPLPARKASADYVLPPPPRSAGNPDGR